jgi:Protein of unknown function (DUF4446)
VELNAAVTSTLAIVGVAVGVVALMMAGAALVGQRRVRKAYQVFAGDRQDDILTVLQRHVEQVAELREDVGRQHHYADQLRSLISGCVSRIGTVRFDAFDDMGGRLSFSVALLDERGDGTVITAINGRTETRAYAKPVIRGESRHVLSQEEVAAITQALERGQSRSRREGGTRNGGSNVPEPRTPAGQASG